MEKKKISWITGLKGLAALLVFVHHFFLFFYPYFCNGNLESIKSSRGIEEFITNSPLNFLGWGGSLAVSLFFTISGFLVAYSFYVRSDRKISVKSVLTRYLKLMIPVLITSLVLWVVLKTNAFRTQGLLGQYKELGVKEYYQKFEVTFTQMIKDSVWDVFFYGGSSVNPPLWTMKAELIGSVLLMLFLSVFGNYKKRYIPYIAAVLFNFNNYNLCFLIGAILCDIAYNKEEWLSKINKREIKLIVLLLGIWFGSFTYIVDDLPLYQPLCKLTDVDLNMFWHNMSAACIILFILLSVRTQRLLSFKPFERTGDLSFNIYAFHWALIHTVSIFTILKLAKYMKYFYACMISLTLTFILLILVSLYFEKKINKATKYVVKKVENIL